MNAAVEQIRTTLPESTDEQRNLAAVAGLTGSCSTPRLVSVDAVDRFLERTGVNINAGNRLTITYRVLTWFDRQDPLTQAVIVGWIPADDDVAQVIINRRLKRGER